MFRIIKNPIFIILATVITIIFYISLSKTEQKSATSADQVKKLEIETADLKAKTQVLEKKLQNPEEEKIIRDEFLMKKTGEYVVKIPTQVIKENPINQEETLSPWKKWRKILF